MKTLYCLVCDKELTYSFPPDTTDNQIGTELIIHAVNDAVCCMGIGNYGSTIFDPHGQNPEELMFWVCDDCLRSKADRVTYIKSHKVTKISGIQSFRDYLKKRGK
jgi:hypothetical protein